jgi:hypothetical protein
VRESIQRVLRDGTLVTVAFAIALGYSLYSVAQGANYLVTTFFREFPDQPGIGDLGQAFAVGSLTWEVGDRYLTFGALVGGLLEVGVVLAAAAFVYWWRDREVRSSAARG